MLFFIIVSILGIVFDCEVIMLVPTVQRIAYQQHLASSHIRNHMPIALVGMVLVIIHKHLIRHVAHAVHHGHVHISNVHCLVISHQVLVQSVQQVQQVEYKVNTTTIIIIIIIAVIIIIIVITAVIIIVRIIVIDSIAAVVVQHNVIILIRNSNVIVQVQWRAIHQMIHDQLASEFHEKLSFAFPLMINEHFCALLIFSRHRHRHRRLSDNESEVSGRSGRSHHRKHRRSRHRRDSGSERESSRGRSYSGHRASSTRSAGSTELIDSTSQWLEVQRRQAQASQGISSVQQANVTKSSVVARSLNSTDSHSDTHSHHRSRRHRKNK